MNPTLLAEVGRLGGDPADPVWQWLLLRGPHGKDFTWSQTRSQPPGCVGVTHLESIVREKVQVEPDFVDRARRVVELAFSSTHPNVLCRAIQVAAVLGSRAELRRLVSFESHEDSAVSGNARAAVFHLQRRLRVEGIA